MRAAGFAYAAGLALITGSNSVCFISQRLLQSLIYSLICNVKPGFQSIEFGWFFLSMGHKLQVISS